MKPALLLVLALCVLAPLASCGVKNDLVKPDGTATPKNTPDPSMPPFPLGR